MPNESLASYGAVREQKCRGHLHVKTVELNHDNLTVAAHVGVRVGLGEHILHFLKQRRLAVAEVNLEAVMDVDGEKEVQVNVAGWTD